MHNGELTVICQGVYAPTKCQEYCENVLKMHWKGDADDTDYPGCGDKECCQKRTRRFLRYEFISIFEMK